MINFDKFIKLINYLYSNLVKIIYLYNKNDRNSI